MPRASTLPFLPALLCLCLATAAQAQPVRTLETGFERDVNRYRWTALARLVQNVGAWDLSVENRFASDAFVLFQNRLSFRDENQLAWQVGRPLGDRFSTRVQGRGAWFTQSHVFSHDVYAGVRYHPHTALWVEPVVGLAWDRRPGVGATPEALPLRSDIGPAYGVRLDLSPPPIDGYDLHLETDGTWQMITPRRGHAVRLAGSARRAFEAVRFAAEVGYANVRRDAYQAVSFLNRGTPTERLSETVEATTSDTLLARLQLEAPFYRGIRLTSTLDLSANNRLIRTLRAPVDALFFDTDFSRRALDAEVGLLYEARRVLVRLAAQGGAGVETHQLTNRDALPPTQAAQKSNLLEQADYDQGHFALQASSRLTLGRAILTFDGRSSILRHDTPAANLDDRDELFHNGQLGVRIVLSRYLLADVRLFGTYYHTVYLNAARSAENNVQRSLRLRPALEWRPGEATQLRLSTELRATYTVDDFVLPGRRPTDQSARELRYDGSLEQNLGGGLRLFVTGSYSALHLGRLLWNEFAEIPFDTLRTYGGWIRLQAGRRIVADVGLRFFIRSDYDRATTVRYPRVDAAGAVMRDETGAALLTSITRPGREWIEQIGPTCAVTWPMRNASTLRLDGWLNMQRIHQDLYGTLPDLAADRIREAGRRGTRKVIPNVALTVQWRL